MLNYKNKSFKEDLSLKDTPFLAFKKGNRYTLINTNTYLNNYECNIKKVSIPNILYYIKNYFSTKINICMKNFQYCKKFTFKYRRFKICIYSISMFRKNI